MQLPSKRVTLGLAALIAVGLVAAGCGDDNESTTGSATTTTSTTSTTASENIEQTVDSAVQSCTEAAQNLGGSVGSAVEAACKSVGSAFKQDLSSAGDDVDKALTKAAKSCRQTVNQLPSGQAQDALSKLCDAIASGGDGS